VSEHIGTNAVELSGPAAAWLADQPTVGGPATVHANFLRAAAAEDKRLDRERAEKLDAAQVARADAEHAAALRGEGPTSVADVLMRFDIASSLEDAQQERERERAAATRADQAELRVARLRAELAREEQATNRWRAATSAAIRARAGRRTDRSQVSYRQNYWD
jgi:hypothetical protein